MIWMPLETLPGWPEAPALSPVFYLMLLVVLPVASATIIALLGWAPKLSQRAKAEQAPSSTELVELD